MTDRRRPAAGQSGQEDNPFAPPPDDRPDQPWQPRRPGYGDAAGRESDSPGSSGSSGSSDSAGPGTEGGAPGGRNNGDRDGGADRDERGDGNHGGEHGDGGEQEDRQGDQPPSWGSQWSRRQPRRQNGGFGSRPGNGREGEPKGNGKGALRWDPTDPAQRKARYALLTGMWGFFFGLFNIPAIALLLGALALYWGIGSLRTPAQARANVRELEGGSPRAEDRTEEGAPTRGGAGTETGTGAGTRPQLTAAVMGLVTGSLALAIVAATFSLQLIYSDYYHCVDDALTTPAREKCEQQLPEQLRPFVGGQEG